MSCVLTVRGARFDVDRFLALTRLKPDRVRRRGQEIQTDGRPGPVFGTSGFSIVVAEEFSDLKVQVRRAVQFLRSRRVQAVLTELMRFEGVEAVELDFGIPRLEVAAQFDALPPDLVSLAGRFELWLIISHYPVESLSNSAPRLRRAMGKMKAGNRSSQAGERRPRK